MTYKHEITVGTRRIAADEVTYFIADIAANHDGDLGRAKDLIWRAKEAGADCAKFQHFLADRIVSGVGFADGVGKVSHQAGWDQSVVEVYNRYHTRRDWTGELIETCRLAEIEFMTTPYDIAAVQIFAGAVPAYKVGSGDITFFQLLDEISKQSVPVLLATGAADMADTELAVARVLRHNSQVCLLQCNTNYTGSLENFRYVNLRVLQTFAARWPGMPLGLSDHTPGHSAVLGAVALGARVIEKHFTDDNSRKGPDHFFALNPTTWQSMVTATRELECAIGDGAKRIEANEQETVIVQRRALRATKDLAPGTVIEAGHLEALRPCPAGAVSPAHWDDVIGRKLVTKLSRGRELSWRDLV